MLMWTCNTEDEFQAELVLEKTASSARWKPQGTAYGGAICTRLTVKVRQLGTCRDLSHLAEPLILHRHAPAQGKLQTMPESLGTLANLQHLYFT